MSLAGCPRCFGTDAQAVWDQHRRLDDVADLVEESHFSVRITACPACGQRFASLFCERIDWHGGNDPQDWLIIPLTVDEAAALIAAGEAGAEGALRRLDGARRFLLRYFPSDGDAPEVGFRDGAIIVPPHD